MNLFIVLLLSVLSIIFLLVGTLIVFNTHNSNKVMTFSVSLGFVVLILLGIMHLLPDAYEFFSELYPSSKSIFLISLFTLVGFGVILMLDLFGGHHHEEGKHNEENFKHISIITCIFLVVHNFIEGMTIYSSVLLDYKTALLLTIGIGLHNIPLGFTLSSTFSKYHNKFNTLMYIIFIGSSYLFGALVAYIFNDIFMNPLVLGIALTFTFGMILYIAIFEFLPMIKNSVEKNMRNIGLLTGLLLMLLTIFV